MFGYVRCFPPELRMREYEYYRGIYCGLCRSMGAVTGQLSRLSLSYDFVFLTLTRMALLGEVPVFKAKRCVRHPIRRRPSCESTPSTEYAAKASAVLMWHNLADDLSDTAGVRRLPHLVAKPFFARAYRRAHDLSELDMKLKTGLSDFHELEKKSGASADELADGFGRILSDVFSDGLDERRGRIAADIGYHVGRWIYFIDALDDYEGDMKRGEFNPFASMGLPSDEIFRASLTAEMAATETAVELLSSDAETEVIELIKNILYLGTEKTLSDILKKRYGKTETAKNDRYDGDMIIKEKSDRTDVRSEKEYTTDDYRPL